MQIDRVESETIFFDDPIYAFVAALAQCLARFRTRPAVPHAYEEIDHEFLKELGRASLDSGEHVASEVSADTGVREFKLFLRRLR